VNEHDLQFEWDETKAAANLAKHGVSFLTAAEAFASELLERVDDRVHMAGRANCQAYQCTKGNGK
jgi:uncharacterized DUF497 family protein